MPSRDFDAETRQQIMQTGLTKFTLGGTEFTLRPAVAPDTFKEFDSLTPDSPTDEVLATLDRTLISMILPSQEAAYTKMRALRWVDVDPGPDATDEEIAAAGAKLVSLKTLRDTFAWCWEQATGRPFSLLLGSSLSPASNGTPSTDKPDSPDATSPPSTSEASPTLSTP